MLETDHGTLTSVTDNDGTYTTTFSATTPGTATITSKVNGVVMTANVQTVDQREASIGSQVRYRVMGGYWRARRGRGGVGARGAFHLQRASQLEVDPIVKTRNC